MPAARVVKAVHGRAAPARDDADEIARSQELRRQLPPQALLELYGRYWQGLGDADAVMRRVLLRALCKKFGHGIRVGPGVLLRDAGSIELGDGVFLGAGSYLQGRHDGRCVIGARTWIGPHSFLDCRDLVIGAAVGWGPGAKVLGSEHTGAPLSKPIIATDLVIRPVRVGDGADIGTGAILLPGVTVGKGAIVGAGAVVAENVRPYAIAAGVPARELRRRK